MAVDNPKVIDAIGIDRDSGDVVLNIADHLPWDSDSHADALGEKINSYLGFVASGELTESYPAAAGKQVRIQIIFKYPLTKRASQALQSLASQLQTHDIDLVWQHIPDAGAH